MIDSGVYVSAGGQGSGDRGRGGRGPCGSRTRIGCTSRRPERRSWISSTTTWRSGRESSTRCGAAVHDAPLPDRGERREGPEAGARRCTAVAGHRPCPLPRYGQHADELCVTELAHVIWAVQMSTVEFHPWNSRRADVEKPDEWRIDLDPMPRCTLATVRRVAHVVHEVLDEPARSVGRRRRWSRTARVRAHRAGVRVQGSALRRARVRVRWNGGPGR